MTFLTSIRRIGIAIIIIGLTSLTATAQMTGYTDKDLAILDGALATAMNATSIAEPDTAKVAMEELFRQWRIFRAKNFGALENSAEILKTLEAAGEKLFAASQLVDQQQLAEANRALHEANTMLMDVRKAILIAPPPPPPPLPDTGSSTR